jgi:hypothetical protein
MEQRVVVRFFTLKGLKAANIHAELELVYGLEALPLPTAKKWPSGFQQGTTDLFDDPWFGRPLTDDLGKAVASLLTERRFGSCKVLCR